MILIMSKYIVGKGLTHRNISKDSKYQQPGNMSVKKQYIEKVLNLYREDSLTIQEATTMINGIFNPDADAISIHKATCIWKTETKRCDIVLYSDPPRFKCLTCLEEIKL